MYTEKLLERFRHPKHMGEMKNPSGVGEEGNPACGDRMRVYIKVKENIIVEASFLTFGCAAAISNSDVLCELAIGKTVEEAEKITNQDILKELGPVPAIKAHCSILGMQTLRKAIKNYRSKNK